MQNFSNYWFFSLGYWTSKSNLEPVPFMFATLFAPAVPCQYRSVAIYKKLKFSARKIVVKVQQTLLFISCAFVAVFGLFFLLNLLRHLRYVYLCCDGWFTFRCTFSWSLIIIRAPFHDSLPAVNIVNFCNFMLLLVCYVVYFWYIENKESFNDCKTV